MTRNTKERFVPTALAVSIAAIGFVGAAPLAFAEEDEITLYTKPDSEIQLGMGHVAKDRDNTKFGDFTGLDEHPNFAIANTYLLFRGENARYLEIEGSDLGLDSRSLSIEGGQQGNFGLRLSYDELPHYWAHGYESPFLGLGGTRLTLPSGWVASGTTGGMTQLDASMRPFEIKTDRRALGVGLNKFISEHWEVVAKVQRDEKEGEKLIGAVIGNSGGNPRAVILPEPVDWTTDQVELFARYATKKLQLQFGYYGSFFKNDNRALQWQNPYSAIGGWDVDAGYPGGFGQLGLPPDNQFHQLNASVGYSYSPVTRVSGNFSIGRATQDESFLPYTVNPGLTVTTPLPRNSLDGEVISTHASLNFTTRLAPKLGFVAGYRFNKRDNRTPQARYNYVGGDSMNQLTGAAALSSARMRTNLPVDTTKHQVHAELDYHLAAATKVQLGYEFDHIKKTFEAIDWEREHTVKAGVNHRFGEVVAGGLSYAKSDRDTSEYDATAPFIASHTAEFVAAQGAFPWDNVPTQRKFFLAPRKRDKVRAFVNVSPSDQLDLEFSADYKDDNYHKSELGLRSAIGWTANFDATVVFTDTLSGHFFASVDNYRSEQRSVQINGGQQALHTDPNRYWSADVEDRTYTWGLGFRAQPMERVELGGNFVQANSRGKTDVSRAALVASNGQTLAAVAPLPDLISRLNRFELFGTYQLQRDLKLKLEFVHERFRSDDWAVDQVAVAGGSGNGLDRVIGTNEVSPDYNVNIVAISATYSFR